MYSGKEYVFSRVRILRTFYCRFIFFILICIIHLIFICIKFFSYFMRVGRFIFFFLFKFGKSAFLVFVKVGLTNPNVFSPDGQAIFASGICPHSSSVIMSNPHPNCLPLLCVVYPYGTANAGSCFSCDFRNVCFFFWKRYAPLLLKPNLQLLYLFAANHKPWAFLRFYMPPTQIFHQPHIVADTPC